MNTQQNPDSLKIDKVVEQFFNLFNNKSGTAIDLDAINICCIPQTIIIKKIGLDQEVYSLDSFIRPRRRILTDGTLTNFSEWETANETIIKNNIAQRISTYEKSGIHQGVAFSSSGTKLFQLLKTDSGWKVSSLVWEDD